MIDKFRNIISLCLYVIEHSFVFRSVYMSLSDKFRNIISLCLYVIEHSFVFRSVYIHFALSMCH